MTADDYYPFLHAQLFHFVIWTRKGFFLLPVMLNRTYAIQFHCGFHSEDRVEMGKGEIVSVSREKAVDAA